MKSSVKEVLSLAAVIAVVGSAALALSTVREGTDVLPVAAVNAATVVSLTNEERSDQNLPALERNTLLDLAARLKAEDMATKGYYAHIAPDGTTPMDFATRAGYRHRIIGENLVVQRTSAEQVVSAFMGSPGHRANILRKDFTEIGVGTAEGTYKGKVATFTVQIFAAPQSPKENVKPATIIAKTPAIQSAPAVASVPRPPSPVKSTASSAPTKPTPAASTTSVKPLDENVKEMLKPLTPLLGTATSATTSLSELALVPFTPSFSFGAPAVITPSAVSRLEGGTPAALSGSTWTQRVQLLLERGMRTVRSWFQG